MKTFSSMDELKANNHKVCWGREIMISSDCRPATIRIANGDIFCELQYTQDKVPKLAKISLKDGKTTKLILLKKPLDTTNCIKPSENYWNSGCKGEM